MRKKMSTLTKNKRLELKASDIPRFIPGTKLTDPQVKELAAKVDALFGYDVLSKETGINKESLSQTLRRLEIEVLDKDAVEKYMAEKNRPDVGQRKVKNEEDDDEEKRDTRRYQWCNETFGREHSSYSDPVPERVLAKCVQIKEASPDVKFMIHYLERDLDPFMSVKLDNEFFYFEVWDEPNFTGKLTEEDIKRAGL